MKSKGTFNGIEGYALAFGLFLGLCLWKFGNPVILDSKIPSPSSVADYWNDPWPTRWAPWFFLPLAGLGMLRIFQGQSAGAPRWKGRGVFPHRWLWLLPLFWFGWQLFSASATVDAALTASVLWQFSGCLVCYFLGIFLLDSPRRLTWLLVGLLAVFTYCLVRAVNQRLIEFPQNRQTLLAGERSGWTNYPPETLREMRREQVILTTNGVDVANPAILAKFEKGRVYGTLVYPNALAGAILLLFPVSLVLVFKRTGPLRPVLRALVIGLALFLGGAGFLWTESKFGWLIAIALGGAGLFRLKWAAGLKWGVIILVVLGGLGFFAVRFHHYFAAGATSARARLDYWSAAAQTTLDHPLQGTGPGTFQRPYQRLKSPSAEMARLTHNDYLEQFSDSGIPGGLFYAAWIGLALVSVGRRAWSGGNAFLLAIFAGLVGWYLQGMGEFGLYVPALAWTAFTLLGGLLGTLGNQMDNSAAAP